MCFLLGVGSFLVKRLLLDKQGWLILLLLFLLPPLKEMWPGMSGLIGEACLFAGPDGIPATLIRDGANQPADVFTDNFSSYCLTVCLLQNWYRWGQEPQLLKNNWTPAPNSGLHLQNTPSPQGRPILKDDTHPQTNSSACCHLGGATDPSKPAAPGWRAALPPGPSLKSTWRKHPHRSLCCRRWTFYTMDTCNILLFILLLGNICQTFPTGFILSWHIHRCSVF